jgi:tetratricopeptide (TPR) repeat protein
MSRAIPRSRWAWLAGAALVAGLAAIAFLRGGVLGLPAPPSGVTARSAGLADLAGMAQRARALEAGAALPASADPALARAAEGLAAARQGDLARGLPALHEAVERAPDDLVIGNAYRMAVFHLKRAALADPSHRSSLAEQLPPELRAEPIGFLERVRRAHPSRETTLQLALGWADELLLYGALEIKAPASIESVDLLTSILEEEPGYVPALYGRGLNYLHRPARLVWPETHKAAPDAASQDLGRCVAIGRKIGGAPPLLVATLALTLGDAYAKEGEPDRARSWWQIAQNASRDRELLEAVRRRFGWQDDEMLDRLEHELENRMLDLDHPLTDLAIMWREG